MPIDVIVGGQSGDEGKGKISAYLAWNDNYEAAVRVGGPNAGHTVFYRGKPYALKNIPCSFVNPRTRLLIAPGAYLSVNDEFPKYSLFEELKLLNSFGIEGRLGIDPKAIVITAEQTRREQADAELKRLGSVGTGLGMATSDKVLRRPSTVFAKDVPELKPYLSDVAEEVYQRGIHGKVLIEGTQGLNLSMTHGKFPDGTSRDTIASAFMSDCGVGPKFVKDVYAVFKPYHTRVSDVGEVKEEITDPVFMKKLHTMGREVGSVSGRLRRAGKFQVDEAIRAVKMNSATRIAITHIDLFDMVDQEKFLEETLEPLYSTAPYPELALVSTGPGLQDMRDMRIMKRGFTERIISFFK